MFGLGGADLGDQVPDRLRRVAHRMAGQHLPGLGHLDRNPVRFPGHVDARGNRHASSPFHGLPRVQPLPAGKNDAHAACCRL